MFYLTHTLPQNSDVVFFFHDVKNLHFNFVILISITIFAQQIIFSICRFINVETGTNLVINSTHAFRRY